MVEVTKDYEFFDRISLEFIREVKAYYGPDAANGVVNSIADVIGREWAHRIVYSVIAADPVEYMSVRVTAFPVPSPSYPDHGPEYAFENRINLIKEVRSASGLGLKDCKDAVDDLEQRVGDWIKLTNITTKQVAMFNRSSAPTITIPINSTEHIGGPTNTERKRRAIDGLTAAGFLLV